MASPKSLIGNTRTSAVYLNSNRIGRLATVCTYPHAPDCNFLREEIRPSCPSFLHKSNLFSRFILSSSYLLRSLDLYSHRVIFIWSIFLYWYICNRPAKYQSNHSNNHIIPKTPFLLQYLLGLGQETDFNKGEVIKVRDNDGMGRPGCGGASISVYQTLITGVGTSFICKLDKPWCEPMSFNHHHWTKQHPFTY